MASFTSGMLVEISGLSKPAEPVPEAVGIAAVDLNGMKAQLVSFDKVSEKWIAATFDGSMITVDTKYIRALKGEELTSYDFVFGPKSDFDTVGSELSAVLSSKGYAVMKLFVANEDVDDMLSVAKRLEDDDHFSRLAVEFERGYLGKGGSAKTLLLDTSAPETPSYVKESALAVMDQNFGAVSQMLAPYTPDVLGFETYSRTSMLMRQPLQDTDDDKYPSQDIDDGEAEAYMHTMCRKKLTLLQFVGPNGGSLTLSPSGESEGQEIVLSAEPNTLVIMVSSRYDYTYEPSGPALALASFVLNEPAVYTFNELSGDMESLGLGSGPPPPPGEQVSVDGLYCRYGTGADDRMKFWNGVGKAATDGLTEVPFVRWDHGPYFDPDQTRGGAYTRHGCFGIEGVELFDNKFFEISPAEARGMDPCQRQVMEVSYMVLLEGGWDKRSLQRESQHIGHFCGIDKDDWLCMTSNGMVDLSGTAGAASAANAITSNRFSYSLNLKGASMTIDTACSSSLVCTHVSKLHLRFKDFDPMPGSIVNGLNLMLFPGPFVGCCGAGMLSHIGRSFTFNSTADGYARGEACGAAMFKLKQYKADGNMYGCLAGSQANQDGRSASLTAPNGPAQEKCFRAVLKECALTPTEVDCFECHGTGTSLGDPIEVGSFRKVMSVTPRNEPLVITSSKSNVAHSEGGAGFCGFFKCLLQVANCEGAANVHLRVKNPHLDMEGFPCQMLSESVVMRDDAAYSGVSSFGFGGTNAHGEAWGKNIFTTRGSLCQDNLTVFQKKLLNAPPAEITMNGDDVLEWETTGLDPRGARDEKWKVSLDEDGVVTWEIDDEDNPDYGDEFFLQGTLNSWTPEPLDKHDTIPGLWIGTITLGDSGEDQFQIVADNDVSRVYHPNNPYCTVKAAPIAFGKADKELAWVIRGNEGDSFRVEFFQSDKYRSVNWVKQV
uniref:Polyketide synthase AS3D904 n=1 Tax=Azadinium spinosum TaxID=632150 RepID=A0A0A0V936_9DINO|nr:polyketide synthase AS3D904 [Azadinium spinosum]